MTKQDVQLQEVKLKSLCMMYEWANRCVKTIIEDINKDVIKTLNKGNKREEL